MSAKHTPGPWSFGYGVTTEYGEVFGVGVTTKPDWTVVCAVSRPGDVNAIDEANARLIAAAPELLQFARCVVRYAGSAMDDYIADKAREVITKAIG